jgi:hypothetical protein
LDLNDTLLDEVHFFHIGLVVEYYLSWGHDPAEHRNDDLIDKSSLAVIEKVVERLLKFLKDSCILNYISLHHRSDLLVEVKFLYDQVEVIQESLLDVSSDVIIQSGLDVIWLV